MKKIFIVCLAAVAAHTACYKDKGNYDYTDMEPIVVSGIENKYSCYNSDQSLQITPTLENEADYDYCWQIYLGGNYRPGMNITPDTVAITKNLNLELNYTITAGSYLLVFNARNKQTGYTEVIPTDLSIITPYTIGYYFTKEIDGRVDLDFFYSGGEERNWMSALNEGHNMGGSVVKTVLFPTYKEIPSDENTIRALMVMTDNNITIIRIDNGKISKTFDEMFFETPVNRQVEAAFSDAGFNTFYLVIGGEMYQLTPNNGGLAIGPMSGGNRPVKGAPTMNGTIVFVDNSDSFMQYSGSYLALAERSDAPLSCNNMDADLIWQEGYPFPRWRVMSLMKTTGTGEYMLVTQQTDGTYLWLWPAANTIVDVKPIPASSLLVTADLRGGLYDSGTIYLTKGRDLYKLNLADLSETLAFSVPEGETITMVQNVKFPINPQPGDVVINKLAVASHKDGHYKIWMHDVNTTGDLALAAEPAYEGEGLVKCANYLSDPSVAVQGANPGGSLIYY